MAAASLDQLPQLWIASARWVSAGVVVLVAVAEHADLAFVAAVDAALQEYAREVNPAGRAEAPSVARAAIECLDPAEEAIGAERKGRGIPQH